MYISKQSSLKVNNQFFERIVKIAMLMFFSLLVLQSCNNDENINAEIKPQSAKINLVSFKIGGENSRRYSNELKMLEFDSWQEFEETATELDVQVENYDDAFVSTWDRLTLEQLDAKEEELNFDNQQPLIDFENSMGFTNSLRKRFNIENETFLNNEVLDETINPNLTLSFSNGELALVNDNQMVKIGEEIFQFNPNGYVSISFNYDTLLYDLLYNPNAVVGQPGVVIQNNTTADCKGWKATSSPHDYAPNNYRALRVAKIRSAPFYTKTEKMTIHYRKGSRRWKESRAFMSLNIVHALSDNNCNKNGVNATKPMNTYKKRQRRDIHLHQVGIPIIKAENNTGLGGHHRYNNIVTYYALSW